MPYEHDAMPHAEDFVHDERHARPLRNEVLVRRIVEKKTPGGIHIPLTFKRSHPNKKHSTQPDTWRARVVSCGPDVPRRELIPGDVVVVETWAEVGRGLYTGVRLPGFGVLVRYPDDIVCALEER